MRKTKRLFGSLVLGACLVGAAYAQDAEQAISRAANAYAIDTLEHAETLRLESEYRLPFESHDYSSDFHDLSQQRFHVILDMQAQKGSHEFLTEISGTSYHGRTLYEDEKSTFIAYGPDTYVDSDAEDFFTHFGSTFRGSDVLLAVWMTRQDAETRYLGGSMWLGDQHDIVEVEFPNSPPLKVFVRHHDGAITKMERDLPDQRTVYYTFHNHQKSGDVLIAREHSFYIENEPIYFSFNRDIDLNDPRDQSAFELDQDVEPDAERTDQSEMTVRSIGQHSANDQLLHHVCQGEGCTTFMTIENSIIGYGMSGGLAERIDAYREQTGATLPLRYVIASDHHDEDIGGAADATSAGATLWVTDQTAKKLRDAAPAHELDVISQTRQIGSLRIDAISTDHAASTLIAYHQSQAILMQTGHYYSSFIEGPSYARRTAVSLYEALPAVMRDNAVAILSGQDLKPETWGDFVSAIEAHEHVRCHRSRLICQDGES